MPVGRNRQGSAICEFFLADDRQACQRQSLFPELCLETLERPDRMDGLIARTPRQLDEFAELLGQRFRHFDALEREPDLFAPVHAKATS